MLTRTTHETSSVSTPSLRTYDFVGVAWHDNIWENRRLQDPKILLGHHPSPHVSSPPVPCFDWCMVVSCYACTFELQDKLPISRSLYRLSYELL
jgi:hypothetical protein